TFPTNVADLTFDDPIRAARYAVPVLEPHCDIVVALTHLGVPEDRRLAAAVPAIDVIVGGHTHAKLITPERVGNTVIVQHADGVQTLYAHNQKNLVRKGDRVTETTRIAKVGSTGRATGPHVHFEVRREGVAVNPETYLSAASIQIAKAP
ncbi:MAG TPA: peptidoglycan DD-metalloendopeptidase family protein, partial [Candidatus Hydrogenedentes bacterium]|nr:peptidoglycan DD-metalloendopeptidase family protein [Candidatus Hydrogenedentota bacterium]